MGLIVSSDNYKVLYSGVVFAFDENSDIIFDLMADEEFKFSFKLKLTFETRAEEQQRIERKIDGNTIEFKCINFSDLGTGTSAPLKLAISDNKEMYMRFWSYLDGNTEGQKKTRKVEYTFYVGE